MRKIKAVKKGTNGLTRDATVNKLLLAIIEILELSGVDEEVIKKIRAILEL